MIIMCKRLCSIKLLVIFVFINICCVDGYSQKNTEALVLYSANYDQQNSKTGLFINKLTNLMNERIPNSQLVNGSEVMSNSSMIFQFNYSLKGNFIIWSTVIAENFHIYVAPLNESHESFIDMTTELDKNEISHLFAFDWIHNLIYHVYDYAVFVANINRMNILNKILETQLKIIFLNVYPKESLIFWSEFSTTDTGTHGSGSSIIMRANQDGSNKKLLRFRDLGLVFELSVDSTSRRLFWFDYLLNSLSSMDFNGNDFRVISESVNMVKGDDIYGFDLFDHYIYYCNEFSTTQKTICKIDLNDGNISESFRLIDGQLKVRPDFRIIHQGQQPDSDDRCFNSNCSHLCLPVNVTHYRCACPTYKQTEFCVESISRIHPNKGNDEKSNLVKLSLMFSVLIVIILLIAIALYLIYHFRRHYNDEKSTKKSTESNKLNTNYSVESETIEYNEYEMFEHYEDATHNTGYLEILPPDNGIKSKTDYSEMKPTNNMTEQFRL